MTQGRIVQPPVYYCADSATTRFAVQGLLQLPIFARTDSPMNRSEDPLIYVGRSLFMQSPSQLPSMANRVSYAGKMLVLYQEGWEDGSLAL